MDRKLDVGASGLHADGPDDREAGISHPLILPVGERHRRGDGDRVARMHSAGIEVFDGADHDGVVVGIPHHLHFVFLPAEDRLLDEHLAHRREIEASPDLRVELLAVVRHARARSPQREARPDHGRKADLREHFAGLVQAANDSSPAGLETNRLHQRLEGFAVLTPADRVGLGADHLHAVLGKNAEPIEFHRQIERRLAAEGGENRIGFLDLDYLLKHLDRERLDVRPIGRARIGHDRGRVGIDEYHPVAVLPEGLAGLGAGIVEFAGLPDDDRAGADQEDRVEVVAAGHEEFLGTKKQIS